MINGKSNWKRVVKAKYGMSMAFNPDVLSGLQVESLWWRDICSLGGMSGRMGNWFVEVVCKEIGNGSETLFWHDNWCG